MVLLSSPKVSGREEKGFSSFSPLLIAKGFAEAKVDKKEEVVSFLGLKRRVGKTKSLLKPSITMESCTNKVYPKITDPDKQKIPPLL